MGGCRGGCMGVRRRRMGAGGRVRSGCWGRVGRGGGGGGRRGGGGWGGGGWGGGGGGRGGGLLDSSPVFAGEIAACSEALSRYVGWRVEDVLRGVPGAPPLERVDVVQPALFAMVVSLARLWRSY